MLHPQRWSLAECYQPQEQCFIHREDLWQSVTNLRSNASSTKMNSGRVLPASGAMLHPQRWSPAECYLPYEQCFIHKYELWRCVTYRRSHVSSSEMIFGSVLPISGAILHTDMISGGVLPTWVAMLNPQRWPLRGGMLPISGAMLNSGRVLPTAGAMLHPQRWSPAVFCCRRNVHMRDQSRHSRKKPITY